MYLFLVKKFFIKKNKHNDNMKITHFEFWGPFFKVIHPHPSLHNITKQTWCIKKSEHDNNIKIEHS